MTEEEFKNMEPFSHAWPEITDKTVFEISNDTINTLETGRGFGAEVDSNPAAMHVLTKLESLHRELASRKDLFHGLVFGHRSP